MYDRAAKYIFPLAALETGQEFFCEVKVSCTLAPPIVHANLYTRASYSFGSRKNFQQNIVTWLFIASF